MPPTAPNGTRLDFKVVGLDCAEEAALIKRALRGLAAEENLTFDFLNGRLRIHGTDEACTTDAVQTAINATGLRAIPWDEHLNAKSLPEPFLQRHGRSIFAGGSGFLLSIAFLLHISTGNATSQQIANALNLLAILLGALPLLPKAWAAARAFRPDIHLLVIIAAAGAVALNDLPEAAMVVFLFAVSLWLESYSVGRARHAVTALMALTPPTARYLCPCDGDIMEKPVAEVPLGATVLLRPGERAPLDGTVTRGETHVDQSAITGEARLISKAPGELIYAGSINQEGALEYRADKRADDSQLARILHLVEEARAKRAPAEQWVEQFARIYTPAVMLLALAVFLLGPLLFGRSWSEAIYAALVLLLIACPCALVISTPVTIFAGLASAARHGVLIKGGNFLEAIGTVRAFAFDKTGTLTHGKPTVERILPAPGHSEQEVLGAAAGLASESQHVQAQAIRRFASEKGISPTPLQSHIMIPGAGVEGAHDDCVLWMGNHRLLTAHHCNDNVEALDAAHSVVYVGRDQQLLGQVLLMDQLRDTAPKTLVALRALGINEVVLLTGDNEASARAAAQAAGMSTWHAELLPEEKVRAIQALLNQHGSIGMVGDGVNDAPALAAATVGIAMAAVGTDAAIETADIALMNDDLLLLPWLVAHSRRTLRVIKQNIALALGLKGAVFILSVAGYAALWLAIAADMGASFLVIANGLRLLRAKR